LAALLAATRLGNYNGSFTLAFDVQGKRGGLLMAAGSVDQTNTYVFEVSPRAATESASKLLAYWSTANGDDTMVNLWNPADEAQDLVFKLSYAGGHYSLPVHLGARATRMFNISEIVQAQIPDAEGNVIPLSVEEGSGRIAGGLADNQAILVGIDAGIYNVRKATCGLLCFSCDGAESANVTPAPFGIGVGAKLQMDFTDHWDTGAEYDLTDESQWSGNSVTVNSSGLATAGNTATSALISAEDPYEPLAGSICLPAPADNPCPVFFGAGASAIGGIYSATVTNADIDQDNFSFYLSGPSSVGLSGPVSITADVLNGTVYSQEYNSGAAISVSNCTSSSPCKTALTRPSIQSTYTGPSTYPGSSSTFFTVAYASWQWQPGSSGNAESYITSSPFHLSPPFLAFGVVQDTQYNTPQEGACPSATSTAYIYTSSCVWTAAQLRTQFVTQVEENGSGYSMEGLTLESDQGGCSGNAPVGAQRKVNVLESVSSVVGQCGTTMVAGQSVAVYPGPRDKGSPFNCGDGVILVNASTNQNSYEKSIADRCPACFDGHVDNYTSAPYCSANQVGNVPGSPFWNADDQ
jgi:hypothetical protein